MVQRAYFIVHGKEDFEKHPNLLGLLIRVSKNGVPLLDGNGNFIPVSRYTDGIERGVTVVYYTSGDYMIKGIFEVASDRLDESDRRRAKEWKRSIQFIIRPILKSDDGVDFRKLIQKLDLFRHLKNPEKDYRMAIRGKNYIRPLDSHDFEIIEKALQSSVKANRAKLPKDEIMTRKYGCHGEGREHKMLKEWVAYHPESIGLTNVQKVDVEHDFISGDAADIFFEIRGDRYVVVEIETDYPLPGCYQALKYRVLQCAEMGKNINSSNVEAVLVAKTIPPDVRDVCLRYRIRSVRAPVLQKS
ncbi:MAG: EVE domain-containing protein [Candidatus Bathyarchaeota archaeon]|nr:EVE domain-containing protein [Candidatus Bathyarchaeota archaeon]MDH5663579.1 EVE domain-containing protein [Candidatus Bathyarchaeota archaeon]